MSEQVTWRTSTGDGAQHAYLTPNVVDNPAPYARTLCGLDTARWLLTEDTALRCLACTFAARSADLN
ncbi:hypothetical protein [Actinosynnema mirum]|uniref:Uncharacterized protein n=1 Tax=Actinosynnema mirum (strain ATCC 29888 / DSM 43827 / JCM 3225 / NBRC 14064 / NCIMB 13271 / NRRL B-12336 / IMRU 3971 / 101) TaxID=446462 RepID=C6WBK4_ACTMD|nr:hypothetical protein [Actinosynnema mirum]ACU35572.1 hypothetical protein Amir_1623 [Actinosynnema mirum DSM 43827]